MCGANVPAGQACNAIPNVGAQVTPTCTTGTVPTGTGGVIADGTYVLTEQTYYNTGCPTAPISETFIIAGDCFQGVFDLFEPGSIAPAVTGTAATRVTVQGNTIMLTLTCSETGFQTTMQDTPTKTYTATDTTLTMFTVNTGTSSSNPDRVEVLTRR